GAAATGVVAAVVGGDRLLAGGAGLVVAAGGGGGGDREGEGDPRRESAGSGAVLHGSSIWVVVDAHTLRRPASRAHGDGVPTSRDISPGRRRWLAARAVERVLVSGHGSAGVPAPHRGRAAGRRRRGL